MAQLNNRVVIGGVAGQRRDGNETQIDGVNVGAFGVINVANRAADSEVSATVVVCAARERVDVIAPSKSRAHEFGFARAEIFREVHVVQERFSLDGQKFFQIFPISLYKHPKCYLMPLYCLP